MGLIGYTTCTPVQMGAGVLYTYVWAGNGMFIQGRRPGLKVRFPIAHVKTRGLEDTTNSFEFDLPKVPVALVREMWVKARVAAMGNLEELYHLVMQNCQWRLIVPEQTQTDQSCRPLEDGPDSSHSRAVIEVHSHHEMRAFFSPQDDRDETGFRLYGVLGRVLTAPSFRLRVGLYGHFWEIPAEWVFEMPEGLIDAVGVMAQISAPDMQSCRECGCTELEACVENGMTCSWFADDLCSFCAEAMTRNAELLKKAE